MANKLVLRTINSGFPGDINKGSVLSRRELDNNQVHIKGLTISTATTSGTTLILTRLNGDIINVEIDQAITATTDTYTTGVTISNNILSFDRQDQLSAYTVDLSSFSGSNFYTTAATLVNEIIYYDRTDTLSAFTVDLSGIGATGSTLVPLIYNTALAAPNTSVVPAFGLNSVDSASTYTTILGGSGNTITNSTRATIAGGGWNTVTSANDATNGEGR